MVANALWYYFIERKTNNTSFFLEQKKGFIKSVFATDIAVQKPALVFVQRISKHETNTG
jgi:hypothetical protein